jgi:hypothetical protein
VGADDRSDRLAEGEGPASPQGSRIHGPLSGTSRKASKSIGMPRPRPDDRAAAPRPRVAAPRPARRGSEPRTGSNMLGGRRSGLRLAEGELEGAFQCTVEAGQDVAEEVAPDKGVERLKSHDDSTPRRAGVNSDVWTADSSDAIAAEDRDRVRRHVGHTTTAWVALARGIIETISCHQRFRAGSARAPCDPGRTAAGSSRAIPTSSVRLDSYPHRNDSTPPRLRVRPRRTGSG